jgi:hypothetical protein
MLNDEKPNNERTASDGSRCHSEPSLQGDTAAAVEFLLSRPFPLTVWSQAIDRATGNEGKRDTGRFCCRSRLKAAGHNDSVSLTRFVAEASDDGTSQSRPGAAFLFISAF